MAEYESMNRFLGISPSLADIDDVLKFADGAVMFDHGGIQQIMPDRLPFLILNQAVVFSNRNGNKAIITTADISCSDCEGHIPEERMTPLILFSKAIALTGRCIAALLNGGSAVVAEVVKTGPVESLLTFSDLHHATPPLTALSYAEVVSIERRRVTKVLVHSQSWIVSEDRFVPAGKISGLEYAVIPKELFLAALRRKRGQRRV